MKLAQSLNRTVLVAIPAFFGDEETRACKLVEIETAGLWLACDELKDRLCPAHAIPDAWTAAVVGFFPFSQILYVVDPSQFAVLVSRRIPTQTGPTTQAAPKNVEPESSHRKGRPKRENPKPRR